MVSAVSQVSAGSAGIVVSVDLAEFLALVDTQGIQALELQAI